MKLYLMTRPSMRNKKQPMFNYVFAESEEMAIGKVRTKYGDYDKTFSIKEIENEEIENLVIGTDYS